MNRYNAANLKQQVSLTYPLFRDSAEKRSKFKVWSFHKGEKIMNRNCMHLFANYILYGIKGV